MQQHDKRLWPTHPNNYNFSSSSNPTPGPSSYAAPSLKFTFSDADIMDLEPADLMKNQHYQELHKRISDAVKALADATQMNSTLHQENSLLKAEVQVSKLNGMGQHFCMASLALNFSWDHSVSPNDSLSQIPSRSIAPQGLLQQNDQPVIRPFTYPQEVLWLFKDCETDPDINMSATNKSRPPVAPCIRHEDSTLVTSAEYEAIKASGHNIISNHLTNLPEPRDKLAKGKPCTRTWPSAIRFPVSENEATTGLESTGLDMSWIIMGNSYDNLKSTLSTHFPNIKVGIEVLNVMEDSPDYKRADPSEQMMVFLSRLEETNPNDNSCYKLFFYKYTQTLTYS